MRVGQLPVQLLELREPPPHLHLLHVLRVALGHKLEPGAEGSELSVYHPKAYNMERSTSCHYFTNYNVSNFVKAECNGAEVGRQAKGGSG